MSTLSTVGRTPSSRVRCGLDMTMTPSASQSSGCCLRRRSTRPIPSFPCSSSMSRSCELLLFTMIGPILRRNSPSLNIGCTLDVSLVRRITDLSWRVDDKEVWEPGVGPVTRKSMLGCKHKQDSPAQDVSLKRQKCSSSSFVKMLCRLSGLFQFYCRSTAFHSGPFSTIMCTSNYITCHAG